MASQAQQDEETGKAAIWLARTVVLPIVIKSAIELNIIDIIYSATSCGGAFLSPSEIAARIPSKNPDAPALLDRMLRLLAAHDILKCSLTTKENGEAERVYGAAAICKFLARNNEDRGGGSFAPLFLLQDEAFFKRCSYFNDVILEGETPFSRLHGMTIFEYMETDSEFSKVFNRAMSNHTTLIMNKILDVYKGFDGLDVLVDVGGGIGVALNIITSKYPQIRGINFDLPHVIADAPAYSGVEHVKGDMFVSIPKADAIFMKWILHDWSDERCLKLLSKCWQALPNKGKVIVVESILPVAPENGVSSHIAFAQDWLMLIGSPEGKERTQKEYEALAIKSGFSGCVVICCAYNSWVMEFHKIA